MKLFDPNSPLMIALSKLADVVICNIMFCLCSIPVVTIGASLTALFSCMQQLVTDEGREDEGLIFRDFWRAFKANFKQGTLLWLICLLIMGFLGLYYRVVGSIEGPAGRIYLLTFYVLLLFFLFGFIYIFPLQARFRNKVRHTLTNAWLLSVTALPWTLLAALVPILAVYLAFFMNPYAATTGVYLWAVCGFGLVAYVDSFFFRRAFRKISPEPQKEKSARTDGAVFTDEEHRDDDLMIQDSRFSDPDWNRREDLFPSHQPPAGKKRR